MNKRYAVALVPGNEDAFRREVDDAVRADQAISFARNFGRPLLVLIIAGVLAYGGWLYWQHRQQGVAGQYGATLSKAIDDLTGNRPRAAGTVVAPLARADDPTYRALALMVEANAAAAQDDARTAVAKFAAVAADAKVPQEMRYLALIRQTLAEFDTLAPAKVVERLRPVVAQPGPAFASAAELTALAELKRGNDRAAGELFRRIAATPDVPDSLKSRAVQMAGMLGVDAVPAERRPTGAAQ